MAAHCRRGPVARLGPRCCSALGATRDGSPTPRNSAKAGLLPVSTAAGRTLKTACAFIAKPAGQRRPRQCGCRSSQSARTREPRRARQGVARLSARRRASAAERLEQIGFDEVLLVSPAAALDELERVRDFL